MQFYKWLTPEHKGIYGHGDYTGFLPNGKPGKWLPKIARPEPCVRGYHAVTLPSLADHLVLDHAVLYEVECRGSSADGGGKTAFAQIRLVRRVGGVDRPLATVFACECAERVLPIFERERPGDDRPRRAIEAARAWAANPCEETSAAWVAAWIAAVAAAWAAAWDAARAAEREWQGRRLLEIVAGAGL